MRAFTARYAMCACSWSYSIGAELSAEEVEIEEECDEERYMYLDENVPYMQLLAGATILCLLSAE